MSQTTSSAPAAPEPTVWGAVKSRDARALIDSLVTGFGFLETACYVEGGIVVHAQLDWPEGGGIMLGDLREDEQWPREPGTGGFYVVTDRVEEVFARASAAGVEILRAPADQDYGNREFAARDVDGNLSSFGAYRGEPRA